MSCVVVSRGTRLWRMPLHPREGAAVRKAPDVLVLGKHCGCRVLQAPTLARPQAVLPVWWGGAGGRLTCSNGSRAVAWPTKLLPLSCSHLTASDGGSRVGAARVLYGGDNRKLMRLFVTCPGVSWVGTDLNPTVLSGVAAICLLGTPLALTVSCGIVAV